MRQHLRGTERPWAKTLQTRGVFACGVWHNEEGKLIVGIWCAPGAQGHQVNLIDRDTGARWILEVPSDTPDTGYSLENLNLISIIPCASDSNS